MSLPKPHRYMYFPPSQIFGKTLVPVYYWGNTPAIPLAEIAKAVGIPQETALNTVKANRKAISIIDAKTCKPVPLNKQLDPLKQRLCLSMDGICILIISIDQRQVKDSLTRERIIVAKRWLTAQISNRLKLHGKKNQPRWDAGLTKEQAREFKALFAKIGPHKD